METKSDAQLLRDYAMRGLEAAFTEFVRRHTNLVYSAALRQVGSPEAAAEIAQNVFLGLAHGANALVPRLAEEGSLAGWLCRSTRNLSLNFRRDEFRRQSRERKVMDHSLQPTTTRRIGNACAMCSTTPCLNSANQITVSVKAGALYAAWRRCVRWRGEN
ncbi:MAG: sigma-70 family RNA polymerase sigma factor [Verrucomicrobiales bacterium]|nr:sigma-70 family RNA polymerase sigma factor [Verrucomicrobiales bacterium]